MIRLAHCQLIIFTTVWLGLWYTGNRLMGTVDPYRTAYTGLYRKVRTASLALTALTGWPSAMLDWMGDPSPTNVLITRALHTEFTRKSASL